MGDGAPYAPPREVVVQLLDPSYRRPIKTWKFSGRSEISIGRAEDRDVEISDAYVSRLHAELLFRDGRWFLVSKGRNGVVVDSRPITELPVTSHVSFQLGPAGPSLRFSTGAEEDNNSSTLCFDTGTIPLVFVNETKLHEDVGQITTGEYFQKLQQKVEQLRRQRRGR